ncbi:hypothetical protein C0J52_08485, partial [Blattella germanica]
KTILDSIHEDDPNFEGDGYTSLAVIYAVFAVCNWLAPSIISVSGPRVAMLIGAFTYCMFFGNLFVYFKFQGKTHIDSETRTIVFIVLLVVAAIGIVFLLLLRPAQSPDGELARREDGGPMNALKRAFALLVTKEMLLLSITFFYTGGALFGILGILATFGTVSFCFVEWAARAKKAKGYNGAIDDPDLMGGSVVSRDE